MTNVTLKENCGNFFFFFVLIFQSHADLVVWSVFICIIVWYGLQIFSAGSLHSAQISAKSLLVILLVQAVQKRNIPFKCVPREGSGKVVLNYINWPLAVSKTDYQFWTWVIIKMSSPAVFSNASRQSRPSGVTKVHCVCRVRGFIKVGNYREQMRRSLGLEICQKM